MSISMIGAPAMAHRQTLRDRAADQISRLDRRADRLRDTDLERQGYADKLATYRHTIDRATPKSRWEDIGEAQAMIPPYERAIAAVERRAAAERAEAVRFYRAAVDALAEYVAERGAISNAGELAGFDATARRLGALLTATEQRLRAAGVELPDTPAATAD